jgi:hypothetical protein
MENKVCSKCGEEKPKDEFRKNKNTKNGLRTECKVCSTIMNKNYYQNNKEKIKKTNKNWLDNNQAKMKICSYNWSKINYMKKRISTKKWSDNNKPKVRFNHNKYTKERMLIDPVFKLKCYLRTSINHVLRKNGYSKKTRTHNILGCSYEEFKTHLESKFESWMTWDNYGLYNGELNYGWDIDHIIPLSSGKTEDDLINLNHYTNLQPLCSKINRDIKKNK